MPYWWGLTRQKQLSMTATAWLMWLCTCQTVDWCLSMSLGLIVWKELPLLSISVKCLPIPHPPPQKKKKKKKQDDPPLKESWKLNDPPLTEGSKTDNPPPLCSPPPILFDQSLMSNIPYLGSQKFFDILLFLQYIVFINTGFKVLPIIFN